MRDSVRNGDRRRRWLTAHVLAGPRRPSRRDLAAIAALERSVLAVDGGRLKLEWQVLEPGAVVTALLWEDGSEAVGFCGLYRFEPGTVEVVGMVHPAHRRRGVGAALLRAAQGRCELEGVDRPLLVVPRSSIGGRALALAHGGTLEQSEHALVLDGPPRPASRPSGATCRRATVADAGEVGRVSAVAFDRPEATPRDVTSELEPTLIIELGATVVGTLRVARRGIEASIYGLAVDPAFQGRGIGRDVLARVCEDLRAQGVERVALEVTVDNERALGLYTSTGFAPVATEDYYALDLRGRRPGSQGWRPAAPPTPRPRARRLPAPLDAGETDASELDAAVARARSPAAGAGRWSRRPARRP